MKALGPQARRHHDTKDGDIGRNQLKLDQALLELQAVQDIKDFWPTAQRAAHAALPLDFICLCLRPFAVMPSTVFRERAPFSSDEEFRDFQELNPLNPVLAARPGTRLLRMSEVIGDHELTRTEFYRRFMQPYGERYFACACFWYGGTFQGMIGLHRRAEQGDFTPAEMEFLGRLHAHFDRVVQRILNVHRERAVRLSLAHLLGTLPIAMMVLDWDLRVAYRNRSAIEMCGRWNLGLERARVEKCTDAFHVPPEVAAYCTEFKARWNPLHHRESSPAAPESAWIPHPAITGLRARVDLLQLDAAPLSMPVFMVRLEQVAATEPAPLEANGAMAQMIRLSLREREVAALVAEGCSNDEIAGQLHKSVLTVKKQMRSIYDKLGVENRGRLIALLR